MTDPFALIFVRLQSSLFALPIVPNVARIGTVIVKHKI